MNLCELQVLRRVDLIYTAFRKGRHTQLLKWILVVCVTNLRQHCRLGNEVARVFTVNHAIYVLTTLHGSFPSAEFGRGAEGSMRSSGEVTAEPGDGLPQAICSKFHHTGLVNGHFSTPQTAW